MTDMLPDRTRGQTLPDFAIGIAIFLITLMFIALFVPQLILPFNDQEQSVVADRLTGDIVAELTAGGNAPFALDESSTRAFFDQNENEVRTELGVSPQYNLHIGLMNASSAGDATVMCQTDGPDAGEWLSTDCADPTDRLEHGTPPDNVGSLSTTRRSLYTADTHAVLEVRVW